MKSRGLGDVYKRQFQDFAEIAEGYGVTKLSAPAAVVGKPLDPAQMWKTYRVQLVSVRQGQGRWVPLEAGSELRRSDLIVAAGSPADLEKFSRC